MKLSDHIEQTSTGNSPVAFIEQPVKEVEQEDLTMNFFVVGGVINIVMILAYFVWAFRQWKKIDAREKAERKVRSEKNR